MCSAWIDRWREAKSLLKVYEFLFLSMKKKIIFKLLLPNNSRSNIIIIIIRSTTP
jgi:hypothetical protein